jgi:hypothetical protein
VILAYLKSSCRLSLNLRFYLFLFFLWGQGTTITNAYEETLGSWPCVVKGTNNTLVLFHIMSPQEVLYRGRVNDRTVVEDFILKRFEATGMEKEQKAGTVIWRHCVQSSMVYYRGVRRRFAVVCNEARGLAYLLAVSWPADLKDSFKVELYDVQPATTTSPPPPSFDTNGRIITNSAAIAEPVGVLTKAPPASIAEVAAVRAKIENDKLNVGVDVKYMVQSLIERRPSTFQFQFDLNKRTWVEVADHGGSD